MFLRATNRQKDGKDHRYFSVVENQRVAGGKTIQRTVLYLGEINDRQQAAWRKTMAVFDEQQQRNTNLSLFPEDRPLPAGAVDSRRCGPADWSCAAPVRSAIAGWPANSGINSNWDSSGARAFPAAGKP
jgi:hypothetical protein